MLNEPKFFMPGREAISFCPKKNTSDMSGRVEQSIVDPFMGRMILPRFDRYNAAEGGN